MTQIELMNRPQGRQVLEGQLQQGQDGWEQVDAEQLVDIPKPSENDPKVIQAGVDFILESVVFGATDATIQAFEDAEEAIAGLILTKAVYEYTIGSKCRDRFPAFLHEELVKEIETLRKDPEFKALLGKPETPETVKGKLVDVLGDLQKFIADPEDAEIKSVFLKMKIATASSLGNNMLLTKCWPLAVTQIGA